MASSSRVSRHSRYLVPGSGVVIIVGDKSHHFVYPLSSLHLTKSTILRTLNMKNIVKRISDHCGGFQFCKLMI